MGSSRSSHTRNRPIRFELLERKLLLASDLTSSLADPDGVCPDEEPQVAAVASWATPRVREYAPPRRSSIGLTSEASSEGALPADLAIDAFTIDGPNVRVDYSVVGDDFIGTRVQLYKRDTFSTLLYESEILSGEIGDHSLAVPATSLQGIEVGDTFYARVLGFPASGASTNAANDQLDFEFSTSTFQVANSVDDSGADELVREKHTLRELLEVDAAFGWYEKIELDPPAPSDYFRVTLGDHTGDGVSDPLIISDDVYIEGPGYILASISGNNETNIFRITEGTTATLSGITVHDGYTATNGGTIFSEGNLKMIAIRMLRGHADGAGGGIYSTGPVLDMWISVASLCSAPLGGGVYVESQPHADTYLRVNQSTFNANEATATNNETGIGGAFYISGDSHLDVDILSSTISGNSAVKGAGLALFGSADVDVVHATITLNAAEVNGVATEDDVTGGALHLEGTNATFYNSIVAGNISTVGIWQDIYGTFGAASSNNMLRRWGDEQTVGGLADGVAGNIVLAPGTDLGLGRLDSYGGVTMTHYLRSRSPAVDGASDSITSAYGITTDQMGFPRFLDSPYANDPEGDTADIGSYENDYF